ncbi:MAG: OmpH family outer membrane protein [Candidatus Omnitrophica bacterium]|nr:OmpH family outer membrane protein [Candidatus Omnitrophota bacterium]
MKKIVGFFIVLMIMMSFSSTCFSKDLKIGYVDIFKVFNDYDKTKEYDEKLEVRKTAAEEKLEVKKEIIEKLQNKLDLLKDSEKVKEEAKLEKEINEYRDLEREVFTDIKKERDDKMKDIIEDINIIIKDYAKKNGFDLILNANTVLYGSKSMDITNQILKVSNKNYKKKK